LALLFAQAVLSARASGESEVRVAPEPARVAA
jgi:hypothetical protein